MSLETNLLILNQHDQAISYAIDYILSKKHLANFGAPSESGVGLIDLIVQTSRQRESHHTPPKERQVRSSHCVSVWPSYEVRRELRGQRLNWLTESHMTSLLHLMTSRRHGVTRVDTNFPANNVLSSVNFCQTWGRGCAQIGIKTSFYIRSSTRNELGAQKYVGYKF